MKKITRCQKSAPTKIFLGAVAVIEVGAVVYNVTSGSFLPTFAIDPVQAIITAAPAAITVGAMLATWKYMSCRKGRW